LEIEKGDMFKLLNEEQQEKQIKISRICKWREIRICVCTLKLPRGVDPETGFDVHLPNFIFDLNAIHSAIMSQSDLFRKAMRLYLWEGTSQMSAHFATAEEMADAFLATHEHLSKAK
jgi:hypothetical protein